MKNTVYLAGPLGFSEAGRYFLYSRAVPDLRNAGIVVLDPWKLTDTEVIEQASTLPYGEERRLRWAEVSRTIGENNVAAIARATALIAFLDGADVDSGTAAEIGYAAARNKTILGYRSDFRLSGDNEGVSVNLQVEHFILASGGVIHSRWDDVLRAITQVLGLPSIAP